MASAQRKRRLRDAANAAKGRPLDPKTGRFTRKYVWAKPRVKPTPPLQYDLMNIRTIQKRLLLLESKKDVALRTLTVDNPRVVKINRDIKRFERERQAMQVKIESKTRRKTLGRVSDALYVMGYSFPHGAVKIGRSDDTEKRRKHLEACHDFRVVTLALFDGFGYLEKDVHEKLLPMKSASGAGKEWFNVSLDEACSCILAVIAGAESCKGSSS